MVFLAVGLLAVSIVLYVLTGEGDTIAGLQREQFPRVAGLLSILIFLMAGATKLTAGKAADALKALGTWVAIGLVVLVLYAYRTELGEVRDRVVQELQPGSVQTVSPGIAGHGAVVSIRKTVEGHFIAKTQVNGKSIRMIVDTGASTVVLRPEDARKAGIQIAALDYTVPVETANGRAFAARVKLERVSLGELTLEKVEALVTRPGALQQSLLGMSFLSRLRSYEFSGNKLLMKS
ncbi:MAG: TIGR02281 family clan AA aspartic protease [Rhodomicrobium sp.]|jgi:aspartyl protease family protein